jgi:uncharacterized protein YaaW (UPF0174 family)
MKSILYRCKQEDLEYLSQVLESNASFTNDQKRKKLLIASRNKEQQREALIELIDKQIRYYGSSDFAYMGRRIVNKKAGVSETALITDVCKQLKVRIKKGGSFETKLRLMVGAVVEKELTAMSPQQLSESFSEIGMGNADKELVMKHLKSSGKVALMPVLIAAVGPRVLPGIIETVVIGLIERIIGPATSKKLVGEFVVRNPWLGAMGPVVGVLSTAWLVYDIQGPAFRKTIPAMLYLGVVAMRDEEKEAAEKSAPEKTIAEERPVVAPTKRVED